MLIESNHISCALVITVFCVTVRTLNSLWTSKQAWWLIYSSFLIIHLRLY